MKEASRKLQWLLSSSLHLTPSPSSSFPLNNLLNSIFSPLLNSTTLLLAMKLLVKLSPKRLFGSKKARSDVSRSNPSSFSSSSGTPTSVLPDWPDLSAGGAAMVSVKELEELMARLGADPPSRDEVAAVLSEIGCDGDGCVSIDELVSRVGSVCGPARDVELRETFDFFDADRDGRITEAELLGVFRAMGDERCTLEDCRRMIASVDENKNGFVCFADFARMMDLQR